MDILKNALNSLSAIGSKINCFKYLPDNLETFILEKKDITISKTIIDNIKINELPTKIKDIKQYGTIIIFYLC